MCDVSKQYKIICDSKRSLSRKDAMNIGERAVIRRGYTREEAFQEYYSLQMLYRSVVLEEIITTTYYKTAHGLGDKSTLVPLKEDDLGDPVLTIESTDKRESILAAY